MSTTEPIPQLPPPAVVAEGRRPQAEPLPSKRGEIGYVEGVHSPSVRERDSASVEMNLPARHPADRDPSPASEAPTPSDSQNSSLPSATAAQDAPPSPTNSMAKSSSILNFLKPQATFGGLQSATLLVFALQLTILAGTVVGWVFATKFLQHMFNSGGNLSSSVFIHVVFVVAVIAELIFLERRVFQLRAERYSYLHPGEILPRHRTAMTPDTGLSFAPWNRPPLPTYAAALAQSGVGTGDVEDHLIAASPPPAYGNTRGSRLLLQGYLRDSLRAQRPASAVSQEYPQTAAPQSADERPVSYASRDFEWEESQDADRARRLEETLSRLQAPPASGRR